MTAWYHAQLCKYAWGVRVCWSLLSEGHAPLPLPLPRESQAVYDKKSAHTTWNKSALRLLAVRISRITSRRAISAPVRVRVCLQ